MIQTQILKKANEIVKNSNFTKIIKARKNLSGLMLFLNDSNGIGYYFSYNNSNTYICINNEFFKLD
jgi:hypothetical protein